MADRKIYEIKDRICIMKKRPKFAVRDDVLTKTIFRAMKRYYNSQFVCYLKLRKTNRTDLLKQGVDDFVSEVRKFRTGLFNLPQSEKVTNEIDLIMLSLLNCQLGKRMQVSADCRKNAQKLLKVLYNYSKIALEEALLLQSTKILYCKFYECQKD